MSVTVVALASLKLASFHLKRNGDFNAAQTAGNTRQSTSFFFQKLGKLFHRRKRKFSPQHKVVKFAMKFVTDYYQTVYDAYFAEFSTQKLHRLPPTARYQMGAPSETAEKLII